MIAERGQASVELLGALPALLGLGIVLFQLLSVGYASLLAGNAAEAGALALAARADAAGSARAALPGWSRARATVRVDGGRVTVRMRPPAVLSALARKLEVASPASVVRR